MTPGCFLPTPPGGATVPAPAAAVCHDLHRTDWCFCCCRQGRHRLLWNSFCPAACATMIRRCSTPTAVDNSGEEYAVHCRSSDRRFQYDGECVEYWWHLVCGRHCNDSTDGGHSANETIRTACSKLFGCCAVFYDERWVVMCEIVPVCVNRLKVVRL